MSILKYQVQVYESGNATERGHYVTYERTVTYDGSRFSLHFEPNHQTISLRNGAGETVFVQVGVRFYSTPDISIDDERVVQVE